MVVGIGTDVIEVARVRTSITRFGDKFTARIFTPGEISYCQRKRVGAAESFAVRFAAKEAAAKALGTGIARGVRWRDIEVVRRPNERPELLLTGAARVRADSLGIKLLHLSLTHDRGIAIAFVIAEQ